MYENSNAKQAFAVAMNNNPHFAALNSITSGFYDPQINSAENQAKLYENFAKMNLHQKHAKDLNQQQFDFNKELAQLQFNHNKELAQMQHDLQQKADKDRWLRDMRTKLASKISDIKDEQDVYNSIKFLNDPNSLSPQQNAAQNFVPEFTSMSNNGQISPVNFSNMEQGSGNVIPNVAQMQAQGNIADNLTALSMLSEPEQKQIQQRRDNAQKLSEQQRDYAPLNAERDAINQEYRKINAYQPRDLSKTEKSTSTTSPRFAAVLDTVLPRSLFGENTRDSIRNIATNAGGFVPNDYNPSDFFGHGSVLRDLERQLDTALEIAHNFGGKVMNKNDPDFQNYVSKYNLQGVLQASGLSLQQAFVIYTPQGLKLVQFGPNMTDDYKREFGVYDVIITPSGAVLQEG